MHDPELDAMSASLRLLSELDEGARGRVIDWINARFGKPAAANAGPTPTAASPLSAIIRRVTDLAPVHGPTGRPPRAGEDDHPSSPSAREPAVPVEKSVNADFIICLEDGRRLKSLKRYLRTRYRLSPEEYRERWDLPPDYPMTAPNLSQTRALQAQQMGFGKQKRRVVKKTSASPRLKHTG